MLIQRQMQESMERLANRDKEVRPSYTSIDIPEPFKKFYIKLYLQHPYWSLYEFERTGPVIIGDVPDLNQYRIEYNESVQHLETLANALARVAGFPQESAAPGQTDAAAAVAAAAGEFAYLCSGTWSLMGIETEEPIISEESFLHNFTNEGGIDGTTRFLKNITGMWLLEQCRKEWEKAGRDYSYPAIVKMAERATPFRSFVNPDDPRFANPPSMTEAIVAYCRETGQPEPAEDDEYIRCIFESLAFRYKEVLALLSEIAPFPIRKLHVIGGGSMNNLLNQFTANVINMPVVAGPSEATAIGNCMVQARAAGFEADRWELRR